MTIRNPQPAGVSHAAVGTRLDNLKLDLRGPGKGPLRIAMSFLGFEMPQVVALNR